MNTNGSHIGYHHSCAEKSFPVALLRTEIVRDIAPAPSPVIARGRECSGVKAHALLLDRVRLPNWQRRTIYSVTAALVVTGLLWWLLDANRGENGASAAQLWSLRLHGFAAMLGLVFFGSLVSSHIRIAWAINRNRVLGTTLGAVAITLGLTGYGLYYLGGEWSRAVTSWLHLVFGISMPLLLWWHVVRGHGLSA